MSSTLVPPAFHNQLLNLLSRSDRARLLAHCTQVALPLGAVLCEAGERMRFVYFPVESFVSLIAETEGHPGLEVGMIGAEGMLGAQFALGGALAPLRAVVQGAGTAWRMPSAALRQQLLLPKSSLARVFAQYLQVLMAQLATTATCLRFHAIAPRLARWLLMSQDRAHRPTFHCTQEFLGYMLGVRRVGITSAAGMLQRGGLIAYRRGDLTVLDRTGLEAAACSCYAKDQASYRLHLA